VTHIVANMSTRSSYFSNKGVQNLNYMQLFIKYHYIQ